MASLPHFDNTANSGSLSRRLMLCIHRKDEPHSCQVAHGFSLYRKFMEDGVHVIGLANKIVQIREECLKP